MMLKNEFVLSILGVSLFCGCSLQKTTVKYAGNIMQNALPAFYEEDDLQTARETMLTSVKLSEGLLKNDPDNAQIAEITSQGYCGYAFMFVEDDDPQRASLLYKKGIRFSENVLEKRKILENGKLNEKRISKEYVPLLFWNAFCSAAYTKLNLQNPDVIAGIPALEQKVDVLLKVEPSFYYNGPHVLKGVLSGFRPRMLGGNMDVSKEQFEKSLGGEGANFKMNKYFYANIFAARSLDRDLFENLLNDVISTPNMIPEQRLLDEVAKIKAWKLIRRTDELF
jgi:TRAP transporter T-component